MLRNARKSFTNSAMILYSDLIPFIHICVGATTVINIIIIIIIMIIIIIIIIIVKGVDIPYMYICLGWGLSHGNYLYIFYLFMLCILTFFIFLYYSYVQEHLIPSTSTCIFQCFFMIYQSCEENNCHDSISNPRISLYMCAVLP